jgi:hypothetical protein
MEVGDPNDLLFLGGARATHHIGHRIALDLDLQ